jgi:hypothetical protein
MPGVSYSQMEPHADCNQRIRKLEESLLELSEVCAACLRVIATIPYLAESLDKELEDAGVKPGFGARADDLLKVIKP